MENTIAERRATPGTGVGGMMAGRLEVSDVRPAEMTPNQIAEAYRASLAEHRMGLSEAFRIYKKALFWSAVMCLVSIYEVSTCARDQTAVPSGRVPKLSSPQEYSQKERDIPLTRLTSVYSFRLSSWNPTIRFLLARISPCRPSRRLLVSRPRMDPTKCPPLGNLLSVRIHSASVLLSTMTGHFG